MHDHFNESDGGDADVFEVIWIGAPWASIILGLDGGGVVSIERVTFGICESDGVLQL